MDTFAEPSHGLRRRYAAMRLAKLARRNAHLVLEGLVEVIGAGKAGVQPDLGDGPVGLQQQLGGGVDAVLLDVERGRGIEHLAEGPVGLAPQMKGFPEINLRIERPADMDILFSCAMEMSA